MKQTEAYPWYSNDKEYIWEQIRNLLLLPDKQQECKLDYSTLKLYFLTIEALEGNNASYHKIKSDAIRLTASNKLMPLYMPILLSSSGLFPFEI